MNEMLIQCSGFLFVVVSIIVSNYFEKLFLFELELFHESKTENIPKIYINFLHDEVLKIY